MKLLFLFFLTFSVHASPVESLPCYKSFKALLDEWKPIPEWQKQHEDGLSSFFWASPTFEIGEWVLAKEIPGGSVVAKISQSGRIEAVFKGDKCIKEVKSYPQATPVKALKSDKDLNDFIKRNKKGAVYVWSPRMILSEKGISEITKAAKEMKLPLLILLDKNVNHKELALLTKKYGSAAVQRVDSLELKMRNVEQHFPALLVFKDSKIVPEVKYGFEKSGRFKLDLARMLGGSK